jgi:metal transporter CNNM
VAMKSKPPIAVGQANYNGHSARRPGPKGLSSILMLVLSQISHAAASPLRKYLEKVKEDAPEAEDPSLWLYLLTAAILVLLGGAFAGLTIA